jgi:hypothetical protein
MTPTEKTTIMERSEQERQSMRDYIVTQGEEIFDPDRIVDGIFNVLSELSENSGQLECGNYEQDDTTAMNCKHCGRSKWLHSTNILYPLSNTSGQLTEKANQYALSVMPTYSLEELSIISDAVIYGYGLRVENIGQPSEDAVNKVTDILLKNHYGAGFTIPDFRATAFEITKLLPSSPSGENGVNELIYALKCIYSLTYDHHGTGMKVLSDISKKAIEKYENKYITKK